ncbi:MAG TPA: hypothetical protein VMF87_01795, partial [Streptosporangiaceae bacterium]|nr:hypothetical protein [Streptosporangiaceae bacterium]
TLTPHVAAYPVSFDLESGSRYSVLPIFLLQSAVILGVDHAIRRPDGRPRWRQLSVRPALAVATLVAVLAASWVADFRNPGFRSNSNWNWGQIAATWERDCRYSKTGEITVQAGAIYQTLPCDRIRS